VEGLPVVRRFATGQRTDPESNFMGRHRLRLPAVATTVEIGQYLPKEMKDSVQRRALQMTALENGLLTPDQLYRFQQRQGELIKLGVQRLRRAYEANTELAYRPELTEVMQRRIDAVVAGARQLAMREIVQDLR
jgi:hypothetical protein